MTTSLWINNSLSNAKVSWTTLTVPSIAFSIAQNPKSISPVEYYGEHPNGFDTKRAQQRLNHSALIKQIL